MVANRPGFCAPQIGVSEEKEEAAVETGCIRKALAERAEAMAEVVVLEAKPAVSLLLGREQPRENLENLTENCMLAVVAAAHISKRSLPYMRWVALGAVVLVRGVQELTALRQLALVEQIPVAVAAAVSVSAA